MPEKVKQFLVFVTLVVGAGCWLWMSYHPDDFFPPPRKQRIEVVP